MDVCNRCRWKSIIDRPTHIPLKGAFGDPRIALGRATHNLVQAPRLRVRRMPIEAERLVMLNASRYTPAAVRVLELGAEMCLIAVFLF